MSMHFVTSTLVDSIGYHKEIYIFSLKTGIYTNILMSHFATTRAYWLRNLWASIMAGTSAGSTRAKKSPITYR